MSKASPHVVIVGAGPVGLTAALLLGHKGITVTVFEAGANISHELRASTFHPPTLDMMAPFGITAQMLAAGLTCPTWQIRMHPSGDRAVFDLSVLRDDTDYPYRLQCEQSKYCEFVLAAARALPTVTVTFSSPVTGVAQTAEAATVRVRAEDGERDVTADYVIGCDGAHSVVRKALGIELSGDIYPETTILATTHFPFHERLDGLSNVSYCWKPGGTFSLLRLPDVWRVSLYPRQGQTVEEALEPEMQQELLHEIVPDTGRIEVMQTRPYRIHRRLASSYGQGRVYLAGDAAHLNSPSGGMGMNGGIHDAINLCDKLTEIWHGAPLELTERYSRQRRKVALETVQEQTAQNRRMMAENDPAARTRYHEQLRRVVETTESHKKFLMRSSMIQSLRDLEAVV